MEGERMDVYEVIGIDHGWSQMDLTWIPEM